VARRCLSGGICWLVELGERLEPELAADFRSIYGISYYDIGITVSYREAILLVGMLLRNPASWIHAKENQWDYPVTPEWILAKHTFDLLARVNSEKPPPEYPAPWIRTKETTKQSREDVIRRLKLMNPERQ
jgi:hypothetical protein